MLIELSVREERPSHRRRTWNIVTDRFKIVLRVYNLISPETDSGQYEGNGRFDRSCERDSITLLSRDRFTFSNREEEGEKFILEKRMHRYRNVKLTDKTGG